MHRELEWPVSEATCLYTDLYMVYIHLYKIIEGTNRPDFEISDIPRGRRDFQLITSDIFLKTQRI
jgi:hypothetical protein